MIRKSPTENDNHIQSGIFAKFRFHLTVKNNLITNEIAMFEKSQTEDEYIPWLFHATFKKQIIYA